MVKESIVRLKTRYNIVKQNIEDQSKEGQINFINKKKSVTVVGLGVSRLL